jgi:hypothetical protein
LKSTKATDEEKQKMARILKQMFEEEKGIIFHFHSCSLKTFQLFLSLCL